MVQYVTVLSELNKNGLDVGVRRRTAAEYY